MPVKITVERRTMDFDCDAIGIGRDPDNQIALPNDSRLASLHAILRFVNGRWIVESCEGAGPVRIGNGRPSRFAWLNAGDVIHLTEAGPELVFEPTLIGSTAAVSSPIATKPAPVAAPPASASATIPYIPFIPHISGDSSPPKAVAGGAPSVPSPKQVDQHQPVNRHLPLIVFAAISVLMAVLVVGWGISRLAYAPTPAPNVDPTPHVVSAPPEPKLVPPVIPVAQKPLLDPQEFLVLIGIGEMKTDNRPHILGVGWLWDQRTAVASRSIGDALVQVVEQTRSDGSPRQGCVIQGVAFEIGEINLPATCPEISILRLKETADLSLTAREQWKKVNAAGIERSRGLGKSLNYFSYAPLPRPPGVSLKHGFPLCEYDPEKCRLRHDEARLEYQPPLHFLKPADQDVRLERGGLIIDEDRKIVGMAPLNSPIVWTETLERALDAR